MRSVYGIEGLVEEQSNSPRIVDPWRAVLIKRWVVPEQREEVGNDKHETRQSDQVGRHAHWEALDDYVGVERLEDVLGHQRVIDGRVLVLLQVGQELFPHVDHLDCLARESEYCWWSEISWIGKRWAVIMRLAA